ncbi:DUF4255 domain-containing protein [Actinomadura rupiterrae]|uniref:DUF4255 domain-containing protein n=1 Tax=Actinomadura rupiterrae TaxID=559627 RepID=UPI0020A460AC|nr:DUF4255 domain-containing protein [Actinomadura rupiterrae]MCP2342456.1 hypothetical protein [Actinomadura rupiterrae]
MIHEVDEALRTVVTDRALPSGEVRVAFEAPNRDWAAQRNTPTVNAYLYDIREDVTRRERGAFAVHGPDGRVVARRQPPRFFRLSYLVTAWTKRPEDEHRLLSAVLACLLRHEVLPAEALPPGGVLAELGLAVPVTAAVPPPESRSIADIWSALGGELKPSLDVVVTAPMPVSPDYEVGPAVTDSIAVTVGDIEGRLPDPPLRTSRFGK